MSYCKVYIPFFNELHSYPQSLGYDKSYPHFHKYCIKSICNLQYFISKLIPVCCIGDDGWHVDELFHNCVLKENPGIRNNIVHSLPCWTWHSFLRWYNLKTLLMTAISEYFSNSVIWSKFSRLVVVLLCNCLTKLSLVLE